MPLLFEVFEQIESFNKFFRLFDRFSTLWFLANSIFQATFKFLVTSKFLSFLRNFEDPVVDPLQKWKTIRSLPQSKWKPAGLGGMFCPRTIWTNHIFHIWYIFFWCNVEVLLHHWQNNTSCAEESLFLPLRFGVGYCFFLRETFFFSLQVCCVFPWMKFCHRTGLRIGYWHLFAILQIVTTNFSTCRLQAILVEVSWMLRCCLWRQLSPTRCTLCPEKDVQAKKVGV